MRKAAYVGENMLVTDCVHIKLADWLCHKCKHVFERASSKGMQC